MALNLGIGWIFIGIVILVILAVVTLVKKRQSMATGVVTIVSILVVLSMGYIFISNNIQLNSLGSIINGTEIYLNWLVSLFNKAVDITSYVIKMDWRANSTIGG